VSSDFPAAVYVTLYGPDMQDEPLLQFEYTEADARDEDFETWRATKLDAFVEGLTSLMEEHDFITLERTR
jgi:hypothetical protein